MSYPVGATLVATLKVRKLGALVDPTTVAIAVQRADGTLVSPAPTVSPSSTGVYTATIVPDQAGRWIYRWTATGNNADGVHEAWFVVRATEINP